MWIWLVILWSCAAQRPSKDVIVAGTARLNQSTTHMRRQYLLMVHLERSIGPKTLPLGKDTSADMGWKAMFSSHKLLTSGGKSSSSSALSGSSRAALTRRKAPADLALTTECRTLGRAEHDDADETSAGLVGS